MKTNGKRFVLLAFAVSFAAGAFAQNPLASWNQVFKSPVAITSMAYGNGTFVGVGNGYRLISHDGLNWTVYVNPPVLYNAGIAFGGGRFVTFGTNSESGLQECIYESTNGLDYSPIYTTSLSLSAASYGNNVWVFIGKNLSAGLSYFGNFVSATMPAAGLTNWNWSEFQLASASTIPVSIAYANGNFVTLLWGSSPMLFSSPDGITWQYIATVTNYNQYSVSFSGSGLAYGNGVYLLSACAYSNSLYVPTILTSSNLIQWTPGTSWGALGYGLFFPPLAFGGNQFVTGGLGIISSSNGYAWSNDISGISFTSITFGQGTFVGVMGPQIYQSGIVAPPSNSPSSSLAISTYPGVSIIGTPGLIYQIQCATNLNSNWITLTNFSLPYSPYLWIDTSSTAIGQKFYRSVQLQ